MAKIKGKNLKRKLVKSEEISGFEHILDFLDEEEEISVYSRKGPSISKKQPENHTLYNMLEYELERLKRMDKFWGEQVPSLRKYDLIDSLIRKRTDENEKKKSKVLKRLVHEKSPLHRSMETIFNSVFTKSEKNQ